MKAHPPQCVHIRLVSVHFQTLDTSQDFRLKKVSEIEVNDILLVGYDKMASHVVAGLKTVAVTNTGAVKVKSFAYLSRIWNIDFA